MRKTERSVMKYIVLLLSCFALTLIFAFSDQAASVVKADSVAATVTGVQFDAPSELVKGQQYTIAFSITFDTTVDSGYTVSCTEVPGISIAGWSGEGTKIITCSMYIPVPDNTTLTEFTITPRYNNDLRSLAIPIVDPRHTVTFRVVNGKWDDDSTANIPLEVEHNAYLHENQIPAVGNKPSSGFKAGSWSPSTPTNETVITDDTTFTYTYAQDEPTPPSPTVYNVTVTTDGHGEAFARPRSGVSGTEVTLREVPDDGYRFKQWEVISGGVELDNYRDYTTSFTIKSADVEIKAHFDKKEEYTRENDYGSEESKSEAAWTPEKAAATIAAEKAAKQQAAGTQMAAVQTLLRTLATTKLTARPEEARKVIGLDMTKVDILDPSTVNLLVLNNKFEYNIKIPVAGGLTTTVKIPANFNFRPFIKADGTMNIHEVLWSIILSRK